MALMSHLIKDRHGTYYTRRIVPPALRPFMPEPWKGKAEWKRTLGTKDPKEAKRANIAMLAQMQAAFTVAEARQPAATRDSLTDEEIKALSNWYGLEALSEDTAFRESGYAEDEAVHGEVRAQLDEQSVRVPPETAGSGWGMSDRQLHKRREGLEDVLAALKAGLGRGDTRLVEDEVDDLAAVFGLTIKLRAHRGAGWRWRCGASRSTWRRRSWRVWTARGVRRRNRGSHRRMERCCPPARPSRPPNPNAARF